MKKIKIIFLFILILIFPFFLSFNTIIFNKNIKVNIYFDKKIKNFYQFNLYKIDRFISYFFKNLDNIDYANAFIFDKDNFPVYEEAAKKIKRIYNLKASETYIKLTILKGRNDFLGIYRLEIDDENKTPGLITIYSRNEENNYGINDIENTLICEYSHHIIKLFEKRTKILPIRYWIFDDSLSNFISNLYLNNFDEIIIKKKNKINLNNIININRNIFEDTTNNNYIKYLYSLDTKSIKYNFYNYNYYGDFFYLALLMDLYRYMVYKYGMKNFRIFIDKIFYSDLSFDKILQECFKIDYDRLLDKWLKNLKLTYG